jgi:haloalkane dehalogenase
MSYIFIELFNYRPTWEDAGQDVRASYVERLIETFDSMPERGIDIIAYGFNDLDTDSRAAYDFFSVYQVASIEAQRAFEDAIRQAGWYEYFEQVNLRGAARSAADILRANATLLRP